MSYDCRVNVRNERGLTPMEIARREGYNDIIGQLSGLQVNCVGIYARAKEKSLLLSILRMRVPYKWYFFPHLQNCSPIQRESGGLADSYDEFRFLLLRNEANSVIESPSFSTNCRSRTDSLQSSISIEDSLLKSSLSRMVQNEKTWREKVEMARAEVLAHCESRIAEVEKQCQMRVARIEKQCTNRLQAAKDALSDSTKSRAPSAPLHQKQSEYKISVLSLP